VAVLGHELAKAAVRAGGSRRTAGVPGRHAVHVVGVMRPSCRTPPTSSATRTGFSSPRHALRPVRRPLPQHIVYRARSSELTKPAERRVYETMGRKYRFDPTDKDAGVLDTASGKPFGNMFVAFQHLLRHRRHLHPDRGRIGVATSCTSVVRERTRESAATRRGCHARRHHAPILRRGVMIVAMGAASDCCSRSGWSPLGGLPIKEFVGSSDHFRAGALATLTLARIVAFAAGLLPARRAAALDPWRRCAPDVLHPAARIHRRPQDATHPGVPHVLAVSGGRSRRITLAFGED